MGIGKYEGNETDKVWSEKNKEIQKLLANEGISRFVDSLNVLEGVSFKIVGGNRRVETAREPSR